MSTSSSTSVPTPQARTTAPLPKKGARSLLKSASQPPKGTKSKQKALPRNPRARVTSKLTEEQLVARREEVKLLPELIRQHYTTWEDGAKDFQLKCMEAQVLQTDVMLHAATGSGKTGIAAGPHLLLSSKGKVTLVVSPLLALHDEQVAAFQDEFKLMATAVNRSHGGCTKKVMEEIVNGQWQIVVLSPEMLQSRRFVEGVLRKPEFGARCLSVFIDEAHCCSHWGADFRKKYGSIGIVRAFLPRSTPLIAVTATLTPRVHKDLLLKLQFDPSSYLFVNIGNDRPNVSQIVRAMEHPMKSFRDIDFVIPDNMQTPEDIPKTFVYYDDLAGGSDLCDHLSARVKEEYRHLGIVRPYNAAFSQKYRKDVLRLFKAGIVRVLVCTDAAGMGCNIPDIDLVVQWKAPTTLSSWVQRAGRVARASGREGLAVMLVEKSAFDIDPTTAETNIQRVPNSSTTRARGAGPRGRGGRGRGRGRGRGTRGSRRGGRYGVMHGQNRGSRSQQHDDPVWGEEPELTADAPAEGLYNFIQATICRREVLRQVFCNEPSAVANEKCCDLCNSKLFDRVRPGQAPQSVRAKQVKKQAPLEWVERELYSWRRAVKRRLYPKAIWSPYAILDDETCELLASVGPFDNKSHLERLIKGTWGRWDALGDELFEFLNKLSIPPLPHGASRKRQLLSSTPAASLLAVTPSAPKRHRTVASGASLSLPQTPSYPAPHFHTPISSSSLSAISPPYFSTSMAAFTPIVPSNAPPRFPLVTGPTQFHPYSPAQHRYPSTSNLWTPSQPPFFSHSHQAAATSPYTSLQSNVAHPYHTSTRYSSPSFYYLPMDSVRPQSHMDQSDGYSNVSRPLN